MTGWDILIVASFLFAVLGFGAVCGYMWGHHLGMLENRPVPRGTV